MPIRMTEAEYQQLLNNREKYINGRPERSLLRGHNGPVPEDGDEEARSPKSRILKTDLGQEFKKSEKWLAAAVTFNTLTKHPILLVIIVIIGFSILPVFAVLAGLYATGWAVSRIPWKRSITSFRDNFPAIWGKFGPYAFRRWIIGL